MPIVMFQAHEAKIQEINAKIETARGLETQARKDVKAADKTLEEKSEAAAVIRRDVEVPVTLRFAGLGCIFRPKLGAPGLRAGIDGPSEEPRPTPRTP